MPKTKTDVTPIRSGLRKRKREEVPQQTEPEVKEEWIPEDKLELWEIRAYRERLERDKNAAITRTRTGTQIKEPQRFEPTVTLTHRGSNNTDMKDMKTKMDDQIKAQHQVVAGGRSVLQTQPINQQQVLQTGTIFYTPY